MATRTMTQACPAPVTSSIDLLQNHPQLAEYASNSRNAHDGHHPHWPKCHDDNRKKSGGGGGAAYYGSNDEVLFCSSPPLPSNDADDDVSPPDSPSMPWRPGSSAYPPPSPVIFPASAIAPALHAQNDSTTDEDSTYSSSVRQSKKELQQLYDSLCEASYDLSLRDIVEPSFSIHGTLLAAAPYSQEAHAAPSEPFSSSDIDTQGAVSPPRHRRRPYRTSQPTVSQVRSQSCRKLDKSIERRSSSDQCKLAFSFSFPRSNCMALPLPVDGLRKTPLRMQENALRTSSSLPRLAHLLSAPDDDKPPSPASSMAVCHNGHLPLSGSSSNRTSFKRSSISTAAHRRPGLAPPSKLKDRNSRRKEQKQQLTMRAGGSSSRVHPSSQCSACASYTIFFKSRCTVCGRLYCSNCAKDAMDLVSAGRRCKSSCDARLGSSRRFSKSIKSKCWPLCGNDIDVSKDPIICKSVC